MIYRNARLEDIPKISALQTRYHINTISEEDRPDGFVTTLFTCEQFKEIIEEEKRKVKHYENTNSGHRMPQV